jgi:hypothetical protein
VPAILLPENIKLLVCLLPEQLGKRQQALQNTGKVTRQFQEKLRQQKRVLDNLQVIQYFHYG